MADQESGLLALIRRAETHLEHLGYREATRGEYMEIWRSLLRFAEGHGFPDGFSRELAARFLADRGVSPDLAVPLDPYHTSVRTRIRVLGEFAETGSIRPYRRAWSPPSVPSSLSGECSAYERFCREHLDHRPATVGESRRDILLFLHFLGRTGLTSFEEVQADHVSEYMASLGRLCSRSRQSVFGRIRGFLRYLSIRGILAWKPEDGPWVPRFTSRHKLPSVFPRGVVEALCAAADRRTETGKRNYAILLLACRLGLRAGDIRTLRLEDIHWDEGTIRTTQQKTRRPLCLPLDDEVAEALIDYLRHGRPRTRHREVFLTSQAPVGPFARSNCLSYVVTDLLEKVKVKLPPGTKRGLHSLRHTLATRLVEAGEPLETIAEILGHKSMETTRIYIEVDVEALRSVALDPDEVAHG